MAFKTCEGCRALEESDGNNHSCTLGYRIHHMQATPLEKCSKPKTIKGHKALIPIDYWNFVMK